jgi:hypothetical protein
MYSRKAKGLSLVLAVILSGCSHKVTSVPPSTAQPTDVIGNGMTVVQTHSTTAQSSSITTPSASVAYIKKNYTMVVKAGGNTMTQTLSNNTEFNIRSNGVHIKGMMLNGILNMRIGNKNIQLEGKQLANYNFKNADVVITIR